MPKQSLGLEQKTSGCLYSRGNPKLKTVKDVPIQTVKDVPILDKKPARWGPVSPCELGSLPIPSIKLAADFANERE